MLFGHSLITILWHVHYIFGNRKDKSPMTLSFHFNTSGEPVSRLQTLKRVRGTSKTRILSLRDGNTCQGGWRANILTVRSLLSKDGAQNKLESRPLRWLRAFRSFLEASPPGLRPSLRFSMNLRGNGTKIESFRNKTWGIRVNTRKMKWWQMLWRGG